MKNLSTNTCKQLDSPNKTAHVLVLHSSLQSSRLIRLQMCLVYQGTQSSHMPKDRFCQDKTHILCRVNNIAEVIGI